MIRCEAITNANRRCKKSACFSGFCAIHGTTECGICKKETDMKSRHTLKNCGHSFCTSCLTNQFYKLQWFEEFSTENVIKCPECELEVCDSDWTFITDYLCKTNLLHRKIIYDTYLCAELCKEFDPFIFLGKEYSPYQIQLVTKACNGVIKKRIPFNSTVPEVVYFQKSTGAYNNDLCYYRFFYGSPSIKNLFDDLQKELVEYVFHPKRITRLGGFEYLDEI
jgi:hypothetical protein